jgi:hypothetical protein
VQILEPKNGEQLDCLWFAGSSPSSPLPFWDVRDKKEAYSRWRRREKGEKDKK